MTNELVFNRDYDAAQVFVMKVFPQDVTTVWEFFTRAELLDQWWAPRPWKCETSNLDFTEGGKWIYAMVGPEGEKHFAGANYHEINWHRSFDWTDYFMDQNGEIDHNLPEVKWLFGFTGVEEGTKLTINIHFADSSEMTQLLEMGFEQGFTAGLNQLEELLNQTDSRQ